MKHIVSELEQLTSAGIISEDKAHEIEQYLRDKQPKTSNSVAVFAILGALLVGLGIALIMAHNWDQFSRTIKTVVAFFPLVVAQLACVYVVLRKATNKAWLESSTTFLTITVGICISLISQVYNIPGHFSTFLLAWLLLIIPLVYIMESAMASLLFISGAAFYAMYNGYFMGLSPEKYYVWGLLLLVAPYYLKLLLNSPHAAFTKVHNVVVAIAVVVSLGTLYHEHASLLVFVYAGFFTLLISANISIQKGFTTNYWTGVGVIGLAATLIVLSYQAVWKAIQVDLHEDWLFSIETLLIVVFLLGSIFFLLRLKGKVHSFTLYGFFIALLALPMLWIDIAVPVVLCNLLALFVGVELLIKGIKSARFTLLNFGLLCIAVLIASRFFDTNMSFVIRGVLFLIVGAGFFIANYTLHKRLNQGYEN